MLKFVIYLSYFSSHNLWYTKQFKFRKVASTRKPGENQYRSREMQPQPDMMAYHPGVRESYGDAYMPRSFAQVSKVQS